MARRQPEQHPPPVQWLQVHYTKTGPARFASHRDLARAFERALRRTGVPMAYSSGFSPHPRISYASAAPTGAASLAEYLEIGLALDCDPEAVRQALELALPPGMGVPRVRQPARRGLAELLTASLWRLDSPEAPPGAMGAALGALLDLGTAVVERATGKGLRRIEVRPALLAGTPAGAGLEVLLAHGAPQVRPDDLFAALVRLEPALTGRPVLATRLAQGRPDEGSGLLDPFAVEAALDQQVAAPPGVDEHGDQPSL